MPYLLLIALASLCLTWLAGYFFMPGIGQFPVFWTAMAFLFLAELLLFGVLAYNISCKTSGKPTHLSMVSGVAAYALFSLLLVLAAPLITASFYIWAPHFLALILCMGVIFALMRLDERNALHNDDAEKIRLSAFSRAEMLDKAADRLRAGKGKEAEETAGRIDLLAEQLKYTMFPESDGRHESLDQSIAVLTTLVEQCAAGAALLPSVAAQVSDIEQQAKRASAFQRP